MILRGPKLARSVLEFHSFRGFVASVAVLPRKVAITTVPVVKRVDA